MRVLIADDDRVARRVLEVTVRGWGYEVVLARDGLEAWAALESDDRVALAILDWMMPGVSGVEICRRVRERFPERGIYIILLTAIRGAACVIEALESGADDYVRKPFDRRELRARLRVGERVITLQTTVAARLRDLQQALASVKQLQGLLPICSYCKRIRVDDTYWQQLEAYVVEHSDAEFTHGICPACFDRVVSTEL